MTTNGDNSDNSDNGDSSDNGDNGDNSDKGDNGDNGDNCDNGDNGDNSDNTDNGDSGENSENGENGDNGDNGENGADPGFLLGGGSLFSCSTSTPINHIVFFLQNTICIRKPQVISGRGCAHPLHPPPRSVFEKSGMAIVCSLSWDEMTAIPRKIGNNGYAKFSGGKEGALWSM